MVTSFSEEYEKNQQSNLMSVSGQGSKRGFLMDENTNKNWNFCVAGNIVKTRIDESGILRHGTAGFSGGTKVYLQGKYWGEYWKKQGIISVIGLSRGKRYECLEVQGDEEAIERFINTIKKGRFIQVDDIERTKIDVISDEQSFEKR